MTKKQTVIYQTRLHLVLTILLITIPFVFLLFFAWIANIPTAKLFSAVFISFVRLLAAYTIAVVLAWMLAVGFYQGKRAAIALPIFDVLQSFPTFAILPLAAYIWGPSNITVIFFLIITVIWPILFSIISSLKLAKKDWEEAAQIMGLRGKTYLRNFLLPLSIPGLVTGSIIGLGEGWEALVATEIIAGNPDGLGSFFKAHSQNVMITSLGVFGLLLLIFIINKLLWLPLLERTHNNMEE
ncbi:MAG: ABC transporter permease subunit [Candidatus Wildermuthbacteria bacterium]|nr:ABC transporter permease subunit [Candidatus Wildermuthbacteria bacterium]